MTERSLGYAYDSELGWAPVPNSTGTIKTFRTTQYKHNSMGLRDEEFTPDAKPTIMFLGDSFVWGLDSQADERFTELLKPKIPDYRIVAAGVSGFGTDQEYLLLKRLWPKVKPSVVVLIFCSQNDRLDNSSNIRYEDYQKPYFATQPDGSLKLMNTPVPRSHILYIVEDWLVRNLWLARMATNAYVRLRYPRLAVPDPSEKIVGIDPRLRRRQRREVHGRDPVSRRGADPLSRGEQDPVRATRGSRLLHPGRMGPALDARRSSGCREPYSGHADRQWHRP